MYGIYGDIIEAAERALGDFDQTEVLLEYPEVQADKAYYLSVLSQYNRLRALRDKLAALRSALEEQRQISELLSDAKTEEDRATVYGEISALKRTASVLASSLAGALGCDSVQERVYGRIKCKEGSAKLATELFALVKADMTAHGATVEDERTVTANGGYVQEISFTAQGAGVLTRLMPLGGAHKVFMQGKSEELCFAVTEAAAEVKILESDLKIDVFHSHGAGGQNINKVETAIRVTHLPTGLTVVCQDERSQLSNKKRALETIGKRLRERGGQAEKKRIESDISAQYSRKNTPLSFDAERGVLSDTRLKAFTSVPFPMTDRQFTTYLDGLTTL